MWHTGFVCFVLITSALACTDDLSCSLGGVCTAGVCHCDPTWTGEDCSVLNLTPAKSPLALSRPDSSSWGGSVLLGTDGRYHMLTATMLNGCGLSEWQRNSEISHATSPSPEGPFTLQNTTVLGPFSHNPTVHGPTTDGHYLIFHIGDGRATSHGPPLNCSGSRRSAASSLAPGIGAAPKHVSPLILSTDALPGGTWKKANVTSGGSSCNNPGAWLFKNGTVLLVCKSILDSEEWRQMVVYTAPSWRGPYELRAVTPVFGEDPYVYQDPRGNFHMILHSMHPHKTGTTAWSKDGINWIPNGFAGPPNPAPRTSFPSTLALTDGSSISLSRRERHQLLFDANGWPVALFNGVTTKDDPHAGRSWTAVQPIASS